MRVGGRLRKKATIAELPQVKEALAEAKMVS